MLFSSRQVFGGYACTNLFCRSPGWRSSFGTGSRDRLAAAQREQIRLISPAVNQAFSSGTWLGASMGPVHVTPDIHHKVASIRNALRQTGGATAADGLQVIMDFDLTITAPGSEQCHHMFETSPVLSAELRGKLLPFFTGQVEVASYEDWWTMFHEVLVREGLTREQVASVAREASVTLRDGTAEFMAFLQEMGVPLLIVSAGISDIIEETLRHHGVRLENITVRGNSMVFDGDGRLCAFRERPPMHGRNKSQTARRERAYFDSLSERPCFVVVGDKPGDVDVSHGLAPDDRCLKIGFFDHSHEHPHPDLPPLPPPPAERIDPAYAGDTCGVGGELTASGRFDARFEATQEQQDSRHPTGGTSADAPTSQPRFPGRGEEHGAINTALAALTDEGEAMQAAPAFTMAASSSPTGEDDLERDRRTSSAGWILEAEEEAMAALMKRIAGGAASVPAAARVASVRLLAGKTLDTPGSKLSWLAGQDAATQELLQAYGDTFDIVAHGGHSMNLVADLVRHLIQDSSHVVADARARRRTDEG